MNEHSVREVEKLDGDAALAKAVLAGEIVIVRQGLQQAGLADEMRAATLEGLAAALGGAQASAIAAAGFERFHEHVAPADVPRVTEAVYREMTRRARHMFGRLAATLFGTGRTLYFEKVPNVRFHIPYDLAAAHRTSFDAYGARRGQGKITAHAPHRDPWLDCPDNVINVWIAVGPVERGNGLTIFPESYRAKQVHTASGEIARHERLAPPVTFALAPGDMVLFHSDHVHGSELNRTRATRYVVSFRVGLERPRFPFGHYHTYLHAGLASGPLAFAAAVPAKLQWSYARTLAARALRKVRGDRGTDAADPPENLPGDGAIALADLPIGAVRAVSSSACIARLGADEFVATSRRCPHKGADLANGFVRDGALVCPWHNLPFDPATGASPCTSLKPLSCYPVAVEHGRVRIAAAAPAGNGAAEACGVFAPVLEARR